MVVTSYLRCEALLVGFLEAIISVVIKGFDESVEVDCNSRRHLTEQYWLVKEVIQ